MEELFLNLVLHQLASEADEVFVNRVKYDIVFNIDNHRVHGNRKLLATTSEYFRNLLEANPQKKIFLPSVPLEPFKIIMEYLHFGTTGSYEPRPLLKQKLPRMDVHLALDILRMAERFELPIVKRYLARNLVDIVKLANVVGFLELAQTNDLKKLKTACLIVIDLQAKEFIQRKLYLDLSQELLLDILERDSFFDTEINILIMCLKWWEKNKSESLESILARVRFAHINPEELETKVYPLNIVTVEQISNAIKAQETQGIEMMERFKGIKKPYCTNFMAAVRQGLVVSNSDGFHVRHELGKQDACIIFELNAHFFINQVALQFYDDEAEYSYYVDISNDKKNWKRVADYSEYMCKDGQNVFFELQPVRFIKIVGTGCKTQKKDFRLRAIEPHYAKVVIETTTTGLLDPSIVRLFDFKSSNQIFPMDQPHNVHSVMLYFSMHIPIKIRIETSVDGKNWEHALEKTVEEADGSIGDYSTKFEFPPRAAMFCRVKVV